MLGKITMGPGRQWYTKTYSIQIKTDSQQAMGNFNFNILRAKYICHSLKPKEKWSSLW